MIETGRKKEKVILVAAALDDLEKAEMISGVVNFLVG